MLRAFVGGHCAIQPFFQLVVKFGPHLAGETVMKPGDCSQMLFSQHISGKMLYRAEVVTLNSLSCDLLTLCAHHLSSSVFEVTATSLAEYCEKLQQRRSRVARLVSCRRMSTLKGFRHFVIYFTHLQPLWRTTKRSGLTKEWTKAT